MVCVWEKWDDLLIFPLFDRQDGGRAPHPEQRISSMESCYKNVMYTVTLGSQSGHIGRFLMVFGTFSKHFGTF